MIIIGYLVRFQMLVLIGIWASSSLSNNLIKKKLGKQFAYLALPVPFFPLNSRAIHLLDRIDLQIARCVQIYGETSESLQYRSAVEAVRLQQTREEFRRLQGLRILFRRNLSQSLDL